MIRTGIFASFALAAVCALPASAQIGLGGSGGAQVPGVGIGGSGSATIDTRPVTNTARDTADQAHATVETAKQKRAEAAARAKAAKPDVNAGASTNTSAGVGVSPNGASAGASTNTTAGASVNN